MLVQIRNIVEPRRTKFTNIGLLSFVDDRMQSQRLFASVCIATLGANVRFDVGVQGSVTCQLIALCEGLLADGTRVRFNVLVFV